MTLRRHAVLAAVLVALAGLPLAGCSMLTSGFTCSSSDECVAGEECVGSICVARDDDDGHEPHGDGGSDRADAGPSNDDGGGPSFDAGGQALDAGGAVDDGGGASGGVEAGPLADGGVNLVDDGGGLANDDDGGIVVVGSDSGPGGGDDDGGAALDAGPDSGPVPDDAGQGARDAGPVELCGNGEPDLDEQCDGLPGCSDDCVYGSVICLAGNDSEYCYKDIPALAHGFSEQTAPTVASPHPYFDDVTLDCNATQLTDSAASSICGKAVTAHAHGTDAVVYSMRNLTVTGNVGFFGSRRVVFAVYGDVYIATGAALYVDANSTASGAGPVLCAAGNGDGGNEAGGGGGSHGSAGGWGGHDGDDDPGAPNAVTGTSPHADLRAGCRGGAGDEGNTTGGGAGGALQISAGGIVTLYGALSANGGGGNGARGSNGGGGGGSGGDVYLQAAFLDVKSSGAVVAQGGGGGGGGGHGANGPRSPGAVASGGIAGGGGLAGGTGAGAAGDGTLNPAANGGTIDNGGTGGGGGGGGVGRVGVRLYDSADCDALNRARFSPQPACQ